MKLKRGNRIFLSERGHNGFFYPTNRELSLVDDVDAKILSWTGGGEDKVAVVVPENTPAHDWIKTITVRGPVWINRSDLDKS